MTNADDDPVIIPADVETLISRVVADVADWLDHLVVRPHPDGIYPHPGLWLTRGDSSDSPFIQSVQVVDVAVVAPWLCRKGLHRWITTWADVSGAGRQDRCWYCGEPAPTEDA
jgi:hypothetical protein